MYLRQIFFFLFCLFSVIKNEGKIDSLKRLFRNEKEIKNKFDLLIKINKEYLNIDSANFYLSIAEKLLNENPVNAEWNFRKAELFKQKGWTQYIQNNYLKAEEYYSRSIKILDQIISQTKDEDLFKRKFI